MVAEADVEHPRRAKRSQVKFLTSRFLWIPFNHRSAIMDAMDRVVREQRLAQCAKVNPFVWTKYLEFVAHRVGPILVAGVIEVKPIDINIDFHVALK
jgi:hypothetical protein